MFDIDALINEVETTNEPVVYEGTEEVKLELCGCRAGTDKRGFDYIMPNFELAEEAGYQMFSKYFALPSSSMDAKERQRCALAIKRFATCFDLDLRQMFDSSGAVDEDYLRGKTGWAILGIKDDPEYGQQNVIKKMIQSGSTPF